MSSESPEDPYRSPEVTQVSSVSTPGVLGMAGAVVIAILAAGGACCASCFGALFLGDITGGFGFGIFLCAAVTIGTFIGVLVVLTRTVKAGRDQQKDDSDVIS